MRHPAPGTGAWFSVLLLLVHVTTGTTSTTSTTADVVKNVGAASTDRGTDRGTGGGAVASAKHVLLILADDLGYGDLGYTGSEISTPNIDRLARQGVIFESFYVQRACSPTRAALLTGRYNMRYGMQSGVLEEYNNYTLALTETLLPRVLKSLGVVSEAHAIGKWHLGYATWGK